MNSLPHTVHKLAVALSEADDRSSGHSLTTKHPQRRYPARESQKAQTRQRLLDAAVACFTRDGFEATTPEIIAREAGATRSTFYLHFKSTAELALCIGRLMESESLAMIQQLDRLNQPDVQQVRAWLHLAAAQYRAHRPLIMALNRALSSGPEWEAHYAEFAEFYPRGMTRYLARYQGEAREEARRRLLLVYILVERYLYFEVLVQTPLCGLGLDATMAEAIHRLLYADRPEFAN